MDDPTGIAEEDYLDEEGYLDFHLSADYLTGLGFETKPSYLQRLCWLGEGPKPDKIWARKQLFTRKTLRAWVNERSRRNAERRAQRIPAGFCATNYPQQRH